MKTASTLAAALVLGLASLLAAPAAGRAADAYQVDPVHSGVVFRVKHFNLGYIYGRFNELTGACSVDEANPANSSFELQLKADSLDSNNKARDQHLKGPDFFNVKEFPTIGFKSKQIKPVDANTYEVSGDLTLHGVTQPLTVKLTRVGSGKDPRGGYRTGFETTFTLKRSDYGMKFMPEGIGDEVWLMVAFEGTRQ